MKRVCIGLDVGTTNTKAVVLDIDVDMIVAMASTSTPVSDVAGGPLRDATAVAAAVSAVMDEALEAAGPTQVIAVATASVGEEVVLLDEHGAPLSDVPVWYGPHGPEEAQRRGVGRGQPAMSDVDPTFSLFKLAWYSRHRPDALGAAATWTDLSGFVAATLVGRGADGAVVDTSHASRTGLLDLQRRTWDLRPLRALGIECPIPLLQESGTVIDVTARPIGRLPAGVPVVAGGHDHFCGAYGVGLTAGGTAYLSAGTSEAQLVVSPDLPDTSTGVEVGCYVTDGLYYAHLPTPAGRLYQTWRDLLWRADTDDDAVLAALQDTAPASMTASLDRHTGTLDLSRVPVDVTREDLMTALMRGLAEQAEDVTDLLAAATGHPVTQILVAGAPVKSAAWRRLRQEASSRRLEFIAEPQATALGAARIAARGVGGR
ncbi:L-fuculokinase [Euzebya sp.]|uniref:FGGY-family carbohydrate kinase n=1 Tax=Euzebya sp. TaxID=1971409 RepID=UPI003511366D